MLTERTLKKWRKEALQDQTATVDTSKRFSGVSAKEATERILRMTQELLDQHLLRKR